MHLQLRDQQLKMFNLVYIQTPISKFKIRVNQKYAIDTDTNKKSSPNTTLKIVIKTQEQKTREEGNKKDQQNQIQNS